MFNNLVKEKDRQELKMVEDVYNSDVYGYSNDQAFRNPQAVFIDNA